MSQDKRVMTYKRRAEAMRLCADATTEIAAQGALMRLAAEYEALARKLEQADGSETAQLPLRAVGIAHRV
jgi:hypothetical protein